MFEGFERLVVQTQAARIAVRTAGQGRPLLLLHGHPQTLAMWHAVAPALAQRFRVVSMDLRGYGDSSRPPSDDRHEPYSKRAMAQDAVQVMSQLGHAQFDVCAHDRGARVAHRLALDHAPQVRRLMLLDIAPTLAMYRHTHEAFARAYWHWFFLIQPAPLPERSTDHLRNSELPEPVRHLSSTASPKASQSGFSQMKPESMTLDVPAG
jgi:haloacetate dehalogenase